MGSGSGIRALWSQRSASSRAMRTSSGRVLSRSIAERTTASGYFFSRSLRANGASRSALLKTRMRRDLVEVELGEHLVRGLDVLVLRVVARVDDVEEQIGVGRLLERRAERGEEILRQIADEADGVGDDDLAIAVPGPADLEVARARVERGEELVLGEDLRAGERVEQRALAGVRVADDRDVGTPVRVRFGGAARAGARASSAAPRGG